MTFHALRSAWTHKEPDFHIPWLIQASFCLNLEVAMERFKVEYKSLRTTQDQEEGGSAVVNPDSQKDDILLLSGFSRI